MRPARSRRVQAQRKFAQGAYVPPNVVAVVAADNRRDAAQDPRNVTINNMTATGLLDVVSLQSAASSPDRNGYSHLTSQPVVIVERLRGKNLTRDVLPPPSQRETVETRSWEYPHERVNNNVANKKSAEQAMLQTVKKKKDYKRNHPMALRSRRPSKLQLNKIIAESCAPLRKVGSKRKKNSSDEDEPLIFQKVRLQQRTEQLNNSKQTAAGESVPKSIPRPSSPKEKSKNKPCKKRSKKAINTNEISLKETDRRNARQCTAGKKTLMKRTPQEKIHKKCSPKQPTHVEPECSVPFSPPEFTVTVIKEDLDDDTFIQDDNEDLSTPDESISEFVPNDPLSPDVVDNLAAAVTPVATNDQVIPPVPVIQDFSNFPWIQDDDSPILQDMDTLLSSLDDVFEEECIAHKKHVEKPKFMDKAPEGPEEMKVTLSLAPIPKKRVPEGRPDDKPLSLNDVSNLKDDEPVILHSAPISKNSVPEDHPVDRQSSHDAPMVCNDVSFHEELMIKDDVEEDTDDVSMICDEIPENTDDYKMIYDDFPENMDDVPLVYDDAAENADDFKISNDDVKENTGGVPNDNVLEDTGDPGGLLVRKDVMDSPITKLRIASPEPGPSGMATRLNVYNSSSKEYDVVYSDQPMHLRKAADKSVRLERARNVQSEKLTQFVGVGYPSSDANERALIKNLRNTAVNFERTQNVQSQSPTPCIAAERRSSDTDEHVLMEVMEHKEANLERTQNVQLETPMPCAAAACRSDKDVINASKVFLDSRCKVCKPCIRIDKLMKVSALLESQIGLSSKGLQNNATITENELTEREGETEDVEIEIDDAKSTNEDPGNIYLLLPNQSSIMMKLRAHKVHGKEVLGVGLIPKNESLINKEFSLEEHEPLLDQIIENLTIYRDVNFEGQDVNLMSRNVNLEGIEVNSEVRDICIVTEVRSDNTKGRNDNLEKRNDFPASRPVSISSDSTGEISDDDQKMPTRHTAEKRRLKRMASRKKLAMMHERMRAEKEREIARVEEENRQELTRITLEMNNAVAEMSRYHERFTQMEKAKERHVALLKEKIREDVISKIEATRLMYTEVDGMAAKLDKEKDAKKMDLEELSDQDAPGTSSSILPTDGGLLVEAPIYHPSEEDFQDPLGYYERIWADAVRFGICKVVPPPGWKPPFRVHDEMRFDVMNQYISRLFNRWGPAARELCAIKLSLAQQKVNFTRPPLLDGVEVNLPKLYHLVQRHGGLEIVYNKKRWGKVAEDMKFNKGPNTERKLDQIYVKYLLPYDTLSHQERQEIMRKVEIAWNRKNQKLLERALNPLKRQQRLLGLIDSSDDETEDEDTLAAVNEAEDCIIKGAVMNRAKFKKIATMTYENIFGPGSESADPPDLSKIEDYYWRLVTLGAEHVCVHTAAVDTGEEGYGFTKNTSDSYGRHPWNPKMVSQNPRNVLQYLGQVLGVTVPTLLLGMLFSTSCWHKDPHIVAWLEFQLFGPERIWYGIPADQADKFRKAVETLCPTSCQNKYHWLPTDITMIPPNLLREHNVTLSRVTQRDGEYILAFPNSYTCCISTGYTESESVYFAPPSWLESLWTVFKEARESCEPTMFAMEHLLYNIGKDPKADPTILKTAQPLFDKMLREEVTNRQMLQERGLPFVQELLSANSSGKKNTATPFNPRDQDECDYCRATLYLSKVKGLTGRNTVVCLEHALKLLETQKYKETDVDQLQVLVHVSVKELNNVHDDMKHRLGISTA